eukprot:21231-Heterococcus_DN1.PRE.10
MALQQHTVGARMRTLHTSAHECRQVVAQHSDQSYDSVRSHRRMKLAWTPCAQSATCVNILCVYRKLITAVSIKQCCCLFHVLIGYRCDDCTRTLLLNCFQLCLFQAVLLLVQHYSTCSTTVITAPVSQTNTVSSRRHAYVWCFEVQQIWVYSYNISKLWLFQAVLLLRQHYITRLTTVITAPKCQC